MNVELFMRLATVKAELTALSELAAQQDRASASYLSQAMTQINQFEIEFARRSSPPQMGDRVIYQGVGSPNRGEIGVVIETPGMVSQYYDGTADRYSVQLENGRTIWSDNTTHDRLEKIQ